MAENPRGTNVNQAKRIAAGHILELLFHASCHISFQLRQMTTRAVTTSLGDGLTKQEQELVHKIADRVYANGELMRKLGRRLQGCQII